MKKEHNNKVVDNKIFNPQFQKRVMDIIDQNEVIRSTIAIKEALLQAQKEIQKHKMHYEELNCALYLYQKYKKYASIQIEINMIGEAAHKAIEHLKDLPNRKNKIVERNKRKITKPQEIIGKNT